MTTTDPPERAPSPKSPVQNSDHATDTDSNKPLASFDTPVAPTTTADARTEQPANAESTGEAGQGTNSSEELPTPDVPARPQETERPPAERISPEAESLKAMFPDLDVGIIQSVLESVDGDQERAADVLLGMSDPNYVSQQHSAPTQSELDEQLARRLVLEEQQQQAAWHPDQQYPFGEGQRRGRNVPYQPRSQQGHYRDGGDQWGGQSPSAGGGGRDTMSEVQEQISKFAETGKKTFSSLVTKVKAKMQEFDQSRNSSGSASQTSWGSGTPSGAGGPTPASQNQYNQYSTTSPSTQPLSQSQEQYFAPSSGDARSQGYDATPQAQPNSVGGGQAFSSVTASSAAPAPPAERIPPRPPSAGPPPAGNVDPSKIGMLPKRPVSLLGATPPQSNTNPRNDGDEDELDYVENPFEDGKK